MNAIESIHHFSLISPWQTSTLLRLKYGLAVSVLIHASLGLWFAQPTLSTVTESSTQSQRLEIRLLKNIQARAHHKPVLVHTHETEQLTISASPATPVDRPSRLPEPTTSDDRYFAPEEVENMAHVVNVEELPLPENSQTPGGAVYLKVMINESGSADKIDIVTSTLPEEYAKTLVSSFYQAKFSPALIAGQPARSWRIIEIRFDLPESIAG